MCTITPRVQLQLFRGSETRDDAACISVCQLIPDTPSQTDQVVHDIDVAELTPIKQHPAE